MQIFERLLTEKNVLLGLIPLIMKISEIRLLRFEATMTPDYQVKK